MYDFSFIIILANNYISFSFSYFGSSFPFRFEWLQLTKKNTFYVERNDRRISHLYVRCEWNGNLGVLWFYEFINTFVRSNYAIWWMIYEMVKLILRNNYEYKECMGCVCVLCACQMCSKMFTYKLFYTYVYMRFI